MPALLSASAFCYLLEVLRALKQHVEASRSHMQLESLHFSAEIIKENLNLEAWRFINREELNDPLDPLTGSILTRKLTSKWSKQPFNLQLGPRVLLPLICVKTFCENIPLSCAREAWSCTLCSVAGLGSSPVPAVVLLSGLRPFNGSRCSQTEVYSHTERPSNCRTQRSPWRDEQNASKGSGSVKPKVWRS